MPIWLRPDDPFPPIEHALVAPNGLLAVGSDLSAPRLLAAYRRGIFPWYSEGQPVLWWSPDPRMVLRTSEFRVSRSLAKRIRQRRYEIRIDTAFARVVDGCAAPRDGSGGTWITPAMRDAYVELHRRGVAHSVEAWRGGALVGGLYGLSLGGTFFGESMFAVEPDASKVAFATLLGNLIRWGFPLVDCQVRTEHLSRFGAEDWARPVFLEALTRSLELPTRQGHWTFELGPQEAEAVVPRNPSPPAWSEG